MASAYEGNLENMDTKELMESCFNRIFQDVCEGTLQHSPWGSDWAGILYDHSKQCVQQNIDRSKHKGFVNNVDQSGGRKRAGKKHIDATYGNFIIQYYNVTKNYFHWGPHINSGPDSLFTDLANVRNGSQHIPNIQSESERFKEYFALYNTMQYKIDDVADALPDYFDREKARADWKAVLEAFYQSLVTAVGNTSEAMKMNAMAKERSTFGRELSDAAIARLNSRVLKRYPDLYFNESVDLLQEACRNFDSMKYVPYDLEQVYSGNTVKISQDFSDDYLRSWLASIGAEKINSKKTLAELILHNWFASGNGEDLGELKDAASEAQKRRTNRPSEQVEHNADDALIVFMAVAYSYRNKIRAELNRLQRDDALDVYQYAREQERVYLDEQKDELPFVPLRWSIHASAESKLANGEEIMEEVDSPQIILVGEAGSGKSTLLKRLVYLQAKQLLELKTEKIPVYIELQRLQQSSSPLKDALSHALGITVEETEMFLKAGLLTMYLDGFNEILDYSVKRQFALELNHILQTDPSQEVILTDRTVKKNTPVMRKSTKVLFYPLDMDDIRAFITVCTKDDIKNQLLQLCEEKEELIRLFDSPLRLEQMIRDYEQTGVITTNTIAGYIRYLMEREATRKMDRNMDYVEAFLQTLAWLINLDDERRYSGKETVFTVSEEEPGITMFARDDAEEIFGRIAESRSWANADSRNCIQLCVDMGLFSVYGINNNHLLGFSKPEYQTFFFYEAQANTVNPARKERRMEGLYQWLLTGI